MESRFLEKGYHKSVIQDAISKTSVLTQDDCLQKSKIRHKTNDKSFHLNFITTSNQSHNTIKKRLNKSWHILLNDPHLKPILPDKPRITYHRAKTLKHFLAPSKIRKIPSGNIDKIPLKPPGSYSYNTPRCKKLF